MKPFDLEKALAGEPVVTRDGMEANSFHLFDVEDYPLVAVVNGNIQMFAKNGGFYINGTTSDYDLFMAPKKRTVWVNLYPNGSASYWKSKDYADKFSGNLRIGNKAYPIEIEEE